MRPAADIRTIHQMRGKPVDLEPVSSQDAEDLANLRVAAMRPSLERLGRFDPQRAKDRLLANFVPECTRHLVVDGSALLWSAIRATICSLIIYTCTQRTRARASVLPLLRLCFPMQMHRGYPFESAH